MARRRERRPASDETVGWLSFATMFIVGTDTFLVAPLLPELREQFGVDTQVSGWLVSAYALGYALCALVAGPLSDRIDRRRMLVLGMAGFAVLTAACALAWGFWSMAALRFLAGVAAALATPQIWASIPALVPGDRIVRTMGRATAGLAIAQLAGIPLGAFLAAVSWRFSFFAIGGVAVIVTALLAARFPSVPRPAVTAATSRVTPTTATTTTTARGYRAVLASGPLLLVLVAYFVFQTGNFAALSFYGSWFARDFGLDTTGIGIAMIVIGAGNATGSLFGHRLVARWGTARSLRIGVLAMTVGYAVVAVTGLLVPAVALLAIIMLAGGFVFPVMMTTLQARAGTARGTVSSLANVAMYAGTTIGVAVAGPVFAATAGFTGVAILTIAAYLIALLLFTRARPSQEAG